MRTRRAKLNRFVAAALAALLALPAAGQEAPLAPQDQAEAPRPDRVARLLAELADPEEPEWQRVEADLDREWSRSGSAALDLLLTRGKDALEEGQTEQAIAHLTALTDHAPDFAQGWNALASAYYSAGQFGPALDAIGRTLALNPSQYESITGLGLILEDIGDDQEALAAFRAAKAIHPHHPAINEGLDRLERKLAGEAL